MRYLEIEAQIAGMAKNLDRRYIRAFWIAFALVNLAFLFYTVNFMFGDHDWNYVRGASAWNEGAFEGRPLHFVLQAVLFDGQVLPFLNSLFSFAALVLGYILLARYWQVPLTTFNYALFAVFAAVLPYTLVWLYYAKDMLINLSLPLVCVASLLAASAAVSFKKAMAARSCHGADAFCLCLLCRGNQFLCRLPARFRLFRLCRRQTVLDGRARKNASGAGYPGGISFV